MSDDLPCRELVELVTDYLEDALAPQRRRALEEHLRECDGCAIYVDQIRATIAAWRCCTSRAAAMLSCRT